MATASCRRDEALTGHSDRHHEDSVPIKPEQLAALLDALREAGKAELHLAVSLVGLFDLRPAELGVHRVDEGRLYVGNVKRNARTLKVVKPERRALPLDLPGREGEGTKAMALLRSGLVKLPGAIRTQVAEGAGGFSAQISRFSTFYRFIQFKSIAAEAV
ncbi:MAG: hypothetical protein ACK41W_08550 [Cyanobacteriota bacterium]